MRLSWAQVGQVEPKLGPSWPKLGPNWGQVGQVGAKVKPSWVKLEPCWTKLDPSWVHVGCLEVFLIPSRGFWRPCWLQVGSSGKHVGSKLRVWGPLVLTCKSYVPYGQDVKKHSKTYAFLMVFGVGRLEIEAKLVMLRYFLVILAPSWGS